MNFSEITTQDTVSLGENIVATLSAPLSYFSDEILLDCYLTDLVDRLSLNLSR